MTKLEFIASIVGSLAPPVSIYLVARMVLRAYAEGFTDDDEDGEDT